MVFLTFACLFHKSLVLFQIVFVTALFYLLSSSGQLYKPVELIAKLGPVSRGSSRSEITHSIAPPQLLRHSCFSDVKIY